MLMNYRKINKYYMRCCECSKIIFQTYYFDNIGYCIDCFEDILTEDFLNFNIDPVSVTEIE